MGKSAEKLITSKPNKTAATPSEIAVLRAMVEHGTMSAAACALGIELSTVDTHIDNLRMKSGCKRLVQLIAWAARQGILGGPSPCTECPVAAAMASSGSSTDFSDR